jgi:hypothetical protein
MRGSLIAGFLACIFVLAAFAERAEAKVPMIINTGQDIFEAGPLPEPYDKEPKLAGMKAGYMCDIWGVLWAYFSVKNCKAVGYQGDQYIDVPELVSAIEAKYKQSDMKIGAWNKYGKFLLILIILALIGGAVLAKLKGDDEEDDEAVADDEEDVA